MKRGIKMKILSNKKYNDLINLKDGLYKERNKFLEENIENNKLIQELSNDLTIKNNKLSQKEAEFDKLEHQFKTFKDYATNYEENLKSEITALKKAKGGYKKEINKQ